MSRRYDEVKRIIKQEAGMSPSKRTQFVPCAFCTRGGNGDCSCSCGMNEKKYSKFKGCFSGELLIVAPY